MTQIFKTKADASGNVYYLIVDHDKKTFKRDYNCMMWNSEFFIMTVTKRERKRYAEYLLHEGYSETF